jgi:hypothetical protein
MGLNHSPRIVTNGLVVCFDANNPKSYPGTGNTLYNLVNSNNGNATTITTAEAAPGTVIDYNSSTSIDVTFPAINKYTWSVSYLARGTGIPSSNYRVIFRLDDSADVGYLFYADTRTTALPYILHYQKDYHISSWNTQSVVANADFLVGSPATAGPWYMIDTVHRTTGAGSPQPTEWETWVNGASIGTVTNTKNLSNYTDIDQLRLNASGGNAFQLQHFKLYNRSLSEAEVKQNYYAMKGRME